MSTIFRPVGRRGAGSNCRVRLAQADHLEDSSALSCGEAAKSRVYDVCDVSHPVPSMGRALALEGGLSVDNQSSGSHPAVGSFI